MTSQVGVLRHYWRKTPKQNKRVPDIDKTIISPWTADDDLIKT